MSRRIWILMGTAAVLIPLFALLAWAALQQRGQPSGAGINQDFGQVEIEPTPAAAFALQLRDGTVLELSDLRGRAVLIDFWASWCGPCRQESAVLNQAYDAYVHRGVEFVGVNIWDTPEGAEQFLAEFDVLYPTGADTSGSIALDYGVRGIPEKFFVDADGIIRQKYVGPMPESVLISSIERLLVDVESGGGPSDRKN